MPSSVGTRAMEDGISLCYSNPPKTVSYGKKKSRSVFLIKKKKKPQKQNTKPANATASGNQNHKKLPFCLIRMNKNQQNIASSHWTRFTLKKILVIT